MDSRNTLCHKSVKTHLVLDINQGIVRDNTAELDYLTILLFDNCRGAVGQSVAMKCKEKRAVISSATSRNVVGCGADADDVSRM